MSRRRKFQDSGGDRSHIPREERSYVEYHPRLLTHLALTLVRQATEQNKRHGSRSHLPRPNGRDSLSSVSNPPTLNGEGKEVHQHTIGTFSPVEYEVLNELEEVRRDDLYAFGQITMSQPAPQIDQMRYNEAAGNLFEVDPGQALASLHGSETTENTNLAIDPALLADYDEIAMPIVDTPHLNGARTTVESLPVPGAEAPSPVAVAVPTALTDTTVEPQGQVNDVIRPSVPLTSDRFLRSEVSVEEKFERLRREEGFSIGKLHEPSFRRLDSSVAEHKVKLTSNAIAFGYQADRPFERLQTAYTRTVDLPESELADRVEYDMDEQDDHWLEKYNERRSQRDGDSISREIFEITLTKIEKEWNALEKCIPKPERKEDAASEDAKCAICDDGECENTNAIVFCDGCNLAVHQECYGVPYIPEGQWLCRKCFASPIDPVSCVFCPSRQGAFKQTSDLHWAHLLCTSWIPEVTVGNPVFMEPVEGVSNIPPSRWKLTCYICKLKVGACIQCSNKQCYTSFHVSCARRAKLFLQRDPRNLNAAPKSFCDKHAPDWYRESFDAKDAFRNAQTYFLSHTDPRTQTLIGGDAPSRGQFVVSLKRSKQNAVVPAIVFAEILSYMQKFRIRNKSEFIADLCKYWSLKRRSRRGISLLKRLQVQTDDNAAQWTDEEQKKSHLDFGKVLLAELDNHIRPLLDEMMEREALKKERCEMRDEVIEQIYLPMQPILREALVAIRQVDTGNLLPSISAQIDGPDGEASAPDWACITQKVTDAQYVDTDEFENDLTAMVRSIKTAYADRLTKEVRLVNRLEERQPAIIAKCRLQEISRKLDSPNGVAACFQNDFNPQGLTLTEEKPFNWANRDASPLSDLDDEVFNELENGMESVAPSPAPASVLDSTRSGKIRGMKKCQGATKSPLTTTPVPHEKATTPILGTRTRRSRTDVELGESKLKSGRHTPAAEIPQSETPTSGQRPRRRKSTNFPLGHETPGTASPPVQNAPDTTKKSVGKRHSLKSNARPVILTPVAAASSSSNPAASPKTPSSRMSRSLAREMQTEFTGNLKRILDSEQVTGDEHGDTPSVLKRLKRRK